MNMSPILVIAINLKALLFRDMENGEKSRNREFNTELTILKKCMEKEKKSRRKKKQSKQIIKSCFNILILE